MIYRIEIAHAFFNRLIECSESKLYSCGSYYKFVMSDTFY